jgi:DTW domain-containing protein YfiP/GNAT superfamily N-acetyltransferase
VSVCYCAALTTLDTVTRVVILQHPRERRMAIGTARMASLCLPEARLHVGVRWDESPELRAALSDPARPPILLYPGPGARDILADPPAGPVTLIVVDGTWSQTKSVVRDNPVLASLPRFAFAAPTPSEYRIRREPRDDYVSTIEALMHVLGALEGDPARFRALLAPFRAMVDAHLAAQAGSKRVRIRGPRAQPTLAARMPAAITARYDDLLCVVGEANAWPAKGDEGGLGHELVHWVARRVATGETFDVVAAPQNPISPGTPFRIGLDEDRLRSGVARSDLVAAFARFVRPTDVIASWGTYGPRLFEQSDGTLPGARLDLRAVARRLPGPKVGSFEQYAERIAPPPGASPADRAGRRLGMLVRIVEVWRDLAADAGTPSLRRGRAEDADALARILRAAMRRSMPYLPELHTPDEDRAFLRDVVLPHEEVWVAEAGGRVVGFAALGARDGADFLEHLYVAPDQQRRGIGDALFAQAKRRRPDGFKWWVFQRNERARRFYERRGAVLLRLTDGAGNEEKTPDALHEWRP